MKVQFLLKALYVIVKKERRFMNCLYCEKQTDGSKFCNKSCRARYASTFNSIAGRTKKGIEIAERNNLLNETRICFSCEVEKPLSEFYGKTNIGYCKDCFKKYLNNKRRKEKQKCVDYKGGKCSICGYDKSLTALEFHHINPKEKEKQIYAVQHLVFEKVKEELNKCILVCANCHAEIHEKNGYV